MNDHVTLPITHWCRNCDAHFHLDQVRQCVPVPESIVGEEEVLQCPTCNSYHIQDLLDVNVGVQDFTVVFRLCESRNALSDFLLDLENRFPACDLEIIAVQIGNALERREGDV